MPARIADVNNVKDFGAKGDGSTDDTSAIQSAVNNLGNFAGVIFFPPGTYKITSPITYTQTTEGGIIFQGSGMASLITGNVADYLIKITNSSDGECYFVQDLSINNTNAAGGGVYFHGVIGMGVFRCKIQAFNCVTQDLNTENFSCRDCTFFTLPSTPTGSWGVFTSGSAAVVDTCIFQGFDQCIRAGNTGGFVFSNNRMEGAINTGIMLGLDKSGAGSTTADVAIISNTCEGCGVAINAANTTHTSITDCQCNLTTNAPGGVGSYGIRIQTGDHYSIENCDITQSGTTYSVAGLSIESQSLYATVKNTSWQGGFNLGDARFSPLFINTTNPDGRQPTTFSNKPTGPWEGLTYVFTDSTTNTFGATISGTGGHRVEGVYGNDGTWRVSKQLGT